MIVCNFCRNELSGRIRIKVSWENFEAHVDGNWNKRSSFNDKHFCDHTCKDEYEKCKQI